MTTARTTLRICDDCYDRDGGCDDNDVGWDSGGDRAGGDKAENEGGEGECKTLVYLLNRKCVAQPSVPPDL